MKVRSKTPADVFFKTISPVVRLLIISDVLIVGAAAMIAPLFALYIEDYIVGSNALVVSVAMGAYLFSRSILQIPIATFIDKIKGEADDFLLMYLFSLLMAIIPMFYLVITTPLQLYAVQILLGISTAITYPSYMAIFTRHIDKHKEGTEWGIYYTTTDLGSAGLAVMGGYIAQEFGFSYLIIAVTALSVVGALVLAPIRAYIKTGPRSRRHHSPV